MSCVYFAFLCFFSGFLKVGQSYLHLAKNLSNKLGRNEKEVCESEEKCTHCSQFVNIENAKHYHSGIDQCVLW